LAASPPDTFTDRSDDSGAAPDISSVTISSPASEQIVVAVAIANQPTLAPGAAVYLDLDTDRNFSTGVRSHFGADYILHIFGDGRIGALKWDGKGLVDVTMPSLSVVYAQGVATFKVNRSDLGDPIGFYFYVIAQTDHSSNPTAFDLAPDRGIWSYDIAGATVALKVADAVASKPRAGKSWTAKIRVVRSDTGEDLGSEGTVACAARVRRRVLRATFAGTTTLTQSGSSTSFAVCKWLLPETAHGKLVTGTVTASYSGGTATHTFRAKVG
jgi:hypothetical protein